VARKRRTPVSVRGHKRRLPNGGTTYVRRHTRTYWTGRKPPLAVRRPEGSTGSARRTPTRSTSDSTRSPSPKASTTTSAEPTEASAACGAWGCFGLLSTVMILASLISENGERPYLSVIVPFFVAAVVAGWLCGRSFSPGTARGRRRLTTARRIALASGIFLAVVPMLVWEAVSDTGELAPLWFNVVRNLGMGFLLSWVAGTRREVRRAASAQSASPESCSPQHEAARNDRTAAPEGAAPPRPARYDGP
jgi:hypothetical protein